MEQQDLKLKESTFKLKKCKVSFTVEATRIWNSLPTFIVSTVRLEFFKRKLIM